MPVGGRKPKADGHKRHRVPPRHEWIEVPNTPYDGGVPRLPRRRGGWLTRTKRKWQVWSRMPHCRLWTDSDWDFALDSLEVAAQFHEGNERLATELRNREKVLGTTADYRRDLRIRYVHSSWDDDEVEEESTENVSNIDDYRDLSE